MEARIVLTGVTKTYPDGTAALGPIDLTVTAGEMVAVVGPSGCGKSTLLRLVSGLEPATSGDIAFDRRSVGYVFQDPALLPWRTVEANVELLGELHRVPSNERRAAAKHAMATVGLTGHEGKYPRALSGGMRMRASLARALTMRPAVFLFDEPFGAVDEMTRQRLNDELASLFAAERFAGVFVTHSIAEAAYLGTRVVVLSDAPGRVVLDRAVPFAYPRTPDIRYRADFAALCGEVGGALQVTRETETE